MAKKALIQKQQATPKFKVRAYTRCRRCGRARSVYRKFGIVLKYTPDRRRTISGLRRVSKPGLRVYTSATEVPRVLGGMGIAILSTNQGLMTDREARQRRVGGEILCHVW